MRVKPGTDKYQTVALKIGGKEFMVPVVACTPDAAETALLDKLQDYFNQCAEPGDLKIKFALEAEWVMAALGLIYDDLPAIRIRRDDFGKVLLLVTQGTLGEKPGVSSV